jgi:2'-5' RNA ligase
MALVVELGLAAEAEGQVRMMWDALERAGVPSMATHVPAVRPHVTLAVTDDADRLRQMREPLRALIDTVRTELIGPAFFATEPPIMHLAVKVTPELLSLHRRVIDALERGGVPLWPHYETAVWVPHCTLSMGVPRPQLGEAVDACLASGLPIATALAAPMLTDSETGETAAL